MAEVFPLAFDPAQKVHEILLAEISTYDDALMVEVISEEDEASLKLLNKAENAIEFAQSRTFDGDDSAWAKSAQTRCIRKTVFGGNSVIEPGAAWFVEWLEKQGAYTIFSCEGHPHDFHVTFRGSYELAHALADVKNLNVLVFRSKGFPQKGQWTMELDYWPESREERDAALRQLANDMAGLTIKTTFWDRIRQLPPFPV